MFGVMDKTEAASAISKAISDIEVEGIVDDTLKINTKNSKGKVLVEIGREVENSSNIPNYHGIQKLDYTDDLLKLINRFISLKNEVSKAS